MAHKVIPFEVLYSVPAAKHWLAKSGLSIYGLAEEVMYVIVGRIFNKLDLFLDDPFFLFEFSFVECGMEKDVGEELDPSIDVFVEYLYIEGRIFAGCKGIKVAAQAVDVYGDIMRGSLFGPLEEHVFEKMRDAVFVGWFVAGAYLDPYAKDEGTGAFHLLHYYGNAVIEIVLCIHG